MKRLLHYFDMLLLDYDKSLYTVGTTLGISLGIALGDSLASPLGVLLASLVGGWLRS